jgi:hypothetical protein
VAKGVKFIATNAPLRGAITKDTKEFDEGGLRAGRP